MWTPENGKLAEAAAYALIMSRQITQRFKEGPAAGIYCDRLDKREALKEVCKKGSSSLTRALNTESRVLIYSAF